MFELGPVTRALRAIAREAADDRTVAEQICRACVRGLDVDGAAISLLTASPAGRTLWASDGTAGLLEDLQFSLNEGACMEAAIRRAPVLVPDLRHATEVTRWPVFAAAVAEQTEVGALFALPLQWGVIDLGVLDLYRIAPGPLPAAQQRDLLGAADTAALMLLGLRTDPGDGAWLDPDVSGRAEIHQATGMVLAQLGTSAENALARLRAHAFAEQRALVDVAREVVSRQLRFSGEAG